MGIEPLAIVISAVRGQERTYLFEKETIEAHLPEAIVKQRSSKGPRTLQKPSISTPAETDPCFVGVFHTLNQRHAQLYY